MQTSYLDPYGDFDGDIIRQRWDISIYHIVTSASQSVRQRNLLSVVAPEVDDVFTGVHWSAAFIADIWKEFPFNYGPLHTRQEIGEVNLDCDRHDFAHPRCGPSNAWIRP